jgi:excisionase family DNA binding protein
MENIGKHKEVFSTETSVSLLTAQDIAKSLQISEAMAYLLMQRGQIRTVKIGRSVRVRPIDLELFIQASLAR